MTGGGRGAVRRLAGARAVSLLGTGAAQVALLITMYDLTRSAAWVSGTLVASHGTQVFLALFTAGLGDRFDRRKLLVACELAGSGCYAAMVLVHGPVLLLLVALLSAAAASPFHSASAASIPNLVGPEDLSWANSMVGVGRNLGMTVGPVIGGFVTATLGPGAVFGGNAVTFLISAAVIAGVRGSFSGRAAKVEGRRSVFAGLAFLWHDRLLRTLMLGEAVLVMGLGLVQVARVPLVESFGLGSVALGWLDGFWSAGLLIGAVASRRLNVHREPLVFVLGLVGVAGGMALIGASPWFWPIVAISLFVGLSDSMDLLAGQGIRQRRTPDTTLSRVIGANSAMCVLAQMAGYGVSGALVPVVGAQGIYFVGAGVVAGAALICAPAVRLARSEPAFAKPTGPESLEEASHVPAS